MPVQPDRTFAYLSDARYMPMSQGGKNTPPKRQYCE
jgi:hypothetical protein